MQTCGYAEARLVAFRCKNFELDFFGKRGKVALTLQNNEKTSNKKQKNA
jgi:hypothetical protein